MIRTRPCPPKVRHGRTTTAGQFVNAATVVGDLAGGDGEVADAYVTLWCTRVSRLLTPSPVPAWTARTGGEHNEAAELLGSADRDFVAPLHSLLGIKTKAGYGYTPAAAGECKRAG